MIARVDRRVLVALVKRGTEKMDPPNLHYGKPFPLQFCGVQLYP